MSMEESVQHVVMMAIQEVSEALCYLNVLLYEGLCQQ